MNRLETEADLRQAIAQLVSVEPRFARVLERHGLPSLRHMEPGLKSLLRIVTDQLISLKAGEAIWRRLEARLGDFECATVRACPIDELRALGLSGTKAKTFHAAADAFRFLDYTKIEIMPDRDVLTQLTRIHGIGPWTADIYLLSALRRADAWPSGDLALQVAAQDLLGLPERPEPNAMLALASAWSPFRAAAARLLWSHYRGLKGMDQRII